MPAPVRPNTHAATSALRRAAQNRTAEKLRSQGWTVSPPADDADPRQQLDDTVKGIREAFEDLGVPAQDLLDALNRINEQSRYNRDGYAMAMLVQGILNVAQQHKARCSHGCDDCSAIAAAATNAAAVNVYVGSSK